MADFTKMTKNEALEYCHKYQYEYKSEAYSLGEDGDQQYSCLIEILESGTIQPSELPDYGMDFD